MLGYYLFTHGWSIFLFSCNPKNRSLEEALVHGFIEELAVNPLNFAIPALSKYSMIMKEYAKLFLTICKKIHFASKQLFCIKITL